MKHLKKYDVQKQHYIAIADVLRVAAICLIAWYHFWLLSWHDPGFYVYGIYIDLWRLISSGYMMVDVILVLSGFLIALPYAEAHRNGGVGQSAIVFYQKRFWRILPSYLFVIAVTVLFFIRPNNLYASVEVGFKDIVAHLTFTHNLFPETYYQSPLPGVLWTLAVEVQFYILFPLIACGYRKRPVWVCFCLLITAVCFRGYVYRMEDTTFWVNQLPCMLDLYACGMLAAWAYVYFSAKDIKEKTRCGISILGLLCFIGMLCVLCMQDSTDYETVRHGQLAWRLPLGILTGGVLIFGGLAPCRIQKMMGNHITKFFATISYNFYIWHQFIAERLKAWRIPNYVSEMPEQVHEQPWQMQYMILCFLMGITVASIVTFLVERPIASIYRRNEGNLDIRGQEKCVSG